MYKYSHVHGTKEEYCFLTATAKCRTEDDVRAWMQAHHPNIEINRIVED